MGQRSLEDIETYLQEAITNIRGDRAVTSKLLTDLVVDIQKSKYEDTHKQLGLIAAKYVETLQRSNEQLVKIAAILNKNGPTEQKLTEEDKVELFDIIQGSKQDGS
mgnify:CR=1 FL=1